MNNDKYGAAQAAIPAHLREFVEAVATNYETQGHQCEYFCIDCDCEVCSEVEEHKPDCIVLRARALLSAPSPASQPVAPEAAQWEARRYCKGDDEWTAWTPIANDEYERRKNDATFEFRDAIADVRAAMAAAPSSEKGEQNENK